jgi:uncharacterized membrane protein
VAVAVAIAEAVRAIPGAPELFRVTRGQEYLVLPAILVGVWGYAVGNWVGLLAGRLAGAL